MSFLAWWRVVIAGVHHEEVVATVREDAGWSSHFAFMTLMSAGIAVLGLLLSSPAVVIGAMLISPLMGPIIGLGFALATFDSVEMQRAIKALVLGVALAIAFCALVVILSPLRTLTDEIAARTRPNLFDLLVALFSGLAGTYAMIRGRHGTIVGVAIATALMPPIAVIGYGLATQNWAVVGGSSLLFFTNLMTIAAAAAVLARVYGFAPNLSPHQSRLQVTLVMLILAGLAVPLGLSLKRIAWEALASRQARDIISKNFGPKSRLSDLQINYQSDPIEIEATVLTPRVDRTAGKSLTERLSERLGRRVDLSIDQLRTGGSDSDALELAKAKGADAERSADRVAERLAIVAGVDADQVLLDRVQRRANVRAAMLPGATLQTYQELETRVAAVEPGWSIALIPPVLPLGNVETKEGAVTESGTKSMMTAIWAAKRLRLPITVSGGDEKRRAAIAQQLSQGGADTRIIEKGGGAVKLDWLVPSQQE